MKKIPLILSTLVLLSCNSQQPAQKNTAQKNDTTSATKDLDSGRFDTTINIGYGFEVHCTEGGKEDSATVVIRRHNKLLYLKHSLDYFMFGSDSLNPVILSFGDENYELFLEMDNHPNKTTLKGMKFNHDTLAGVFEFPTFIAKPCRIFNDKRLGVAGTWDFSEEWTDTSNNAFITLDPIMYYAITPDGLLLDTTETIRRNKRIFGISNPFKVETGAAIAKKRSHLLREEYQRIVNCK